MSNRNQPSNLNSASKHFECSLGFLFDRLGVLAFAIEHPLIDHHCVVDLENLRPDFETFLLRLDPDLVEEVVRGQHCLELADQRPQVCRVGMRQRNLGAVIVDRIKNVTVATINLSQRAGHASVAKQMRSSSSLCLRLSQ